MEDLHVKYRPDTFDGVIGQKSVVKSLKKVLRDRTARAFIFTGPSGTGKTTLGRIIAHDVGCDKGNIVEIDAATHTGIDSMRQVTDTLNYNPLGKSKCRLIMIDEAHALSKAAWTSLLKSVEEPPAGVYWVFCTTEPTKIPSNIRTRCVVYELKPVPTADIYELLLDVAKKENLSTPDDVLYFIAEKSYGSPRQALVGLSQCCNCETRREAADLLKAASEDHDIIELAQALIKGGLSWSKAMKILEPFTDQNGEGIRLTVVGYVTKVLLGTKDDRTAVRALNILDAFKTPYPQGATIYPVLLSLGQIIFETE